MPDSQAAGQDNQKGSQDSGQSSGEDASDSTAQDSQGASNRQDARNRTEEDKQLSINAIGNMRPDLSGQPLVLPETSDNMDFLNGEWAFDKELIGPDGEKLRWDFSSRNGVGLAVLKDSQNNLYEARMSARLEDGVLKMRTDRFTSNSSPKVYNSEYIECRNVDNAALCAGSDGFGEWKGERIFSARNDVAKSSRTESRTSAQSSSIEKENMAELAADGAEMPAEVLESAQKAAMKPGSEPLRALEGHWRYSQDLARKADGAPVSVEFHFDGNGKGYSLIKGDGSDPFRADATATLMKDGTLRVRTEAYDNGKGQGYYPTFMECKGKNGEDLSCNLSNGWMRSDNGRLVDLNSYQENMQKVQIDELMPGANPEGTASGQNMEDIFANAAEEAQKAINPGSATASSNSSLILPQKGDSASFMEGNWICHTGLASIQTNEPVVLEFSFNKNGKGSSTIVEKKSGQVFRASAQASFRNGILRVNTSQFRGKGGAYNPNSIICRNTGGAAECTGKNGNVTWRANFVRK